MRFLYLVVDECKIFPYLVVGILFVFVSSKAFGLFLLCLDMTDNLWFKKLLMTLVKLKHMSFRRLFTQLQRKHLIHVLSYISSLAMTMRICFCSQTISIRCSLLYYHTCLVYSQGCFKRHERYVWKNFKSNHTIKCYNSMLHACSRAWILWLIVQLRLFVLRHFATWAFRLE